ncbi:MAG TPA: hypothetical protein VJI70_00840 [Candidatus Paceibacterota bacterium]
MPPRPEDDVGSLEKARERLYKPMDSMQGRPSLVSSDGRALPHEWEETPLKNIPEHRGIRRVRLAGMFFIAAFAFFIVALGAAGYFFYFGGNSVSVDKITIDVQGPTTIAGGDIVPLSLTITNRNPVSIENATIEITFPNGTKSADGKLSSYPRYTENLGPLASGATVTRSIKAIIFGGAGQALILPASFSFGTGGSKTVFVKKTSYALAISSTPLSVSVDTLSETVSGKLLTLSLTVRSNATISLNNVVLTSAFPFGFVTSGSSLPMSGSNFLIGTLQPGESKTIILTGTLIGQDNEQRVFHFTVGTSKTASDQTLAVSYMTQDATITIAAPFITTTLALNGDTIPNIVVNPGSSQNVTISYANTLSTSVTNAMISITLSGSAVDYDSIRTENGFYRSADRTIVFSRDTDPSLATLAPGASGIGSFSFSTLPSVALAPAPTVILATSVSGTRVGQSNVPEEVSASNVRTVKVATSAVLSSSTLHSSGLLKNTGPIPPRANVATTYTIQWNVRNTGSAIADGVVNATLPNYISYTGLTAGSGSFSYDSASHTVSWNVGDIAQGVSAQGTFQVSITPSTSQKGEAPALTNGISFSGYDRFAGVQISASTEPSTTETKGDPGYIAASAIVQ